MTSEALKSLLTESTQFKIAIIGIPDDSNSSFLKGTAEGPSAIREQLFSDAYNLWTESGINLSDNVLLDLGDLNLVNTADKWATVRNAIELILRHTLDPISLGGDHAITYPIVRGFKDVYEKLSILHFDAHPDLYDNFLDNPHSHASPFARIMEEHLADRLVQVGIRAATGHQRKQARKFGVEMIEMAELKRDLLLKFDTPVYVSIDIDGLDPAYAPGVSHPEPGGLSTRTVLEIIQRLEGTVVGADIVEVNPQKDFNNITATVAAKLLKEVAGKMLVNSST